MNKRIENLKYEDLLFVDTESVRGLQVFDENSPHYDVWVWKQRNKDTNEIPPSEQVIQSYYDKAGLFAEWSRIVCISVGYIHNEKLYTKSFVGEEKDILKNFIDLVHQQNRMIVGHNLSYDLPCIRKRFFINGLNGYLSDKQGSDIFMKPWLMDESVFDTMVAWKGIAFTNTSLDELAMVFNIPSSKDSFHGNEVSQKYYEGHIDQIQEYCEKDVEVVANILRVWKGDSILTRESKQGKIEKKPILQRLYTSKELTTDIVEELRAIVNKKKPTKKEKEILTDILEKLSIQEQQFICGDVEIIQADKVDVKEYKKRIISELWD